MAEPPRVGVGAIVTRDNEVLLLRRKNVHGAGTWSTAHAIHKASPKP